MQISIKLHFKDWTRHSPLWDQPLVSVVGGGLSAVSLGWGGFGRPILVRSAVAGRGRRGAVARSRSLVVCGRSRRLVLRGPVAGLVIIRGGLHIRARVPVWVHLGAVTHLLANFLRDILDDDPGDGVTNLLGYLDAMLLGYFLLDIHWILSADSFGELFTLFSRDIDWEILASFIWHFLTFCSRDGFFNLLWHLFAMLLRNLKLGFVRLINSYLMTNGIKGLPRASHYHHPYNVWA